MKKDKNNSKIIPFSQLIIGVIIIWIISAIVSWFTFSDWLKSGSFGDTF
ncbi:MULTISPECIES: hypothetical protein [unclassified Flavobacterium]|nr:MULTISPECIES: hypothetical protein [unclassified Flavobacterium]WKL45517.1 hypothetical protein Q1W72_07855 [Flavobacterium sp. ZE23DGlu08]